MLFDDITVSITREERAFSGRDRDLLCPVIADAKLCVGGALEKVADEPYLSMVLLDAIVYLEHVDWTTDK